jgi:hypothetical protein
MDTTLRALVEDTQQALDAHRGIKGGAKATGHTQLAKGKARLDAQALLDVLAPRFAALLPSFLGFDGNTSLRLDSNGGTVAFCWGTRGARGRVNLRSERFASVVGAVATLTQHPVSPKARAWRAAQGSDQALLFAFIGPGLTALAYNSSSTGSLYQRQQIKSVEHLTGPGRDPWEAMRLLALVRLVLTAPRPNDHTAAQQRGWDAGVAWATTLYPQRLPAWTLLPNLLHRLPPVDGFSAPSVVMAAMQMASARYHTHGEAGMRRVLAIGEDTARTALALAATPSGQVLDVVLTRGNCPTVFAANVDPHLFFAGHLARHIPTLMTDQAGDWRQEWALRAVGAPLELPA